MVSHRGGLIKQLVSHRGGLIKQLVSHRGGPRSQLVSHRGGLIKQLVSHRGGLIKQLVYHRGGLIKQLVSHRGGPIKQGQLYTVNMIYVVSMSNLTLYPLVRYMSYYLQGIDFIVFCRFRTKQNSEIRCKTIIIGYHILLYMLYVFKV